MRLGLLAGIAVSLCLGTACDDPPADSAPSERSPGVLIGRFPGGAVRNIRPTDAEGKTHGLAKGYFEGGARRWEAAYQHGQRHGTTRFWHESGGLESVREYRGGLKHLSFTDSYENGAKQAEGRYHEDQLVELREWDADGRELTQDSVVRPPISPGSEGEDGER